MVNTVALNQFLAGVEKRAYRIALFKVKDVDEALDIVQDAMLTLVRKYAAKPEAEWAPLFYRILQNRITDTHRKSSLRARFFSVFKVDQTEPWMDETDADPIQNAADGYATEPDFRSSMINASEKLNTAVEQLPQRQQQAFLMRAWEGLSVAETAFAMHCSQGSVKTHYSRAIHRLREVLKEDWL